MGRKSGLPGLTVWVKTNECIGKCQYLEENISAEFLRVRNQAGENQGREDYKGMELYVQNMYGYERSWHVAVVGRRLHQFNYSFLRRGQGEIRIQELKVQHNFRYNHFEVNSQFTKVHFQIK